MNRSSPILVALLIGPLLTTMVHAQAFEPGNSVAGITLGIGGNYSAYDSYSSVTPAIGLFYEKASGANVGAGVLGLGGFLGYKSLHADGHNPYYNYDYGWTYLILGFRGAYHWNTWHEVPNLDTYAGLMFSYNIETFHDNTNYPDGYPEYSNSSSSGLALTMYLGGRYYFNEKFGVLAELGYGIAVLSIGGQMKF